ncbi:MAG: undecaprenyl-diphosphatase UppP [bacterium]|nr:undecaprenyl-diphosphatase UppP [bacterium]
MLVVVILSIVQGLSEFLPISSSAHLLITPWLFNLANPGLSFDAAIHLGTAAALVIYFYRDFIKLFKAKSPLIKYILIATIPGALIGFFGERWIDSNFHEASYAPLVVGITMIIFSVVLYIADKTDLQKITTKNIGLKKSLFIGFAQALAFIPGVSRSGATITAGLFMGLKREEAARFSFLLATPITIAAGAYKALGVITHPGDVSILQLIVGIVISAIVGIVVIKWLLGYLNRHTMEIFVIYRLIFGAVVISVWLLQR